MRFAGFLIFVLGILVGCFTWFAVEMVDSGNGPKFFIQTWFDFWFFTALVSISLALLVGGLLLMKDKPNTKEPYTIEEWTP